MTIVTIIHFVCVKLPPVFLILQLTGDCWRDNIATDTNKEILSVEWEVKVAWHIENGK